jgi:hypothetical protein
MNEIVPRDNDPRSNVELFSVRQGTHDYMVRYSYYSIQKGGREVYRLEGEKKVEAYTAADAVCQVAILVDNEYGNSKVKILSVTPVR